MTPEPPHTAKSDLSLTAPVLQSEYKKRIDNDIATYSSGLLRDWRELYGDGGLEGIRTYVDMLARGGKRLRGALVLAGYDLLDGTDKEAALGVARVVEMIHAYVLIIDDVADRSSLRRGSLSAHKMLERYHRQEKMHGESSHFGISMAIHAALAGAHAAQSELMKLEGIDDAVKVRLSCHINETLLVTVNGQFNDITNEALQDVTEQKVLETLAQKTAYYSFTNPLQMGALLAGGTADDLDVLARYSEAAGLCFQLKDDVIGTFGDSTVSGKSAMDDIREGKITLMVAHALRAGSVDQRRHLLSSLGNGDLSIDDFSEAKLILEQTGARMYCEQLIADNAHKATAVLEDAPRSWNQTIVRFLDDVTRYITQRQG